LSSNRGIQNYLDNEEKQQVLVKRVVPQDYVSKSLQFKKYNAYYKPFLRLPQEEYENIKQGINNFYNKKTPKEEQESSKLKRTKSDLDFNKYKTSVLLNKVDENHNNNLKRKVRNELIEYIEKNTAHKKVFNSFESKFDMSEDNDENINADSAIKNQQLSNLALLVIYKSQPNREHKANLKSKSVSKELKVLENIFKNIQKIRSMSTKLIKDDEMQILKNADILRENLSAEVNDPLATVNQYLNKEVKDEKKKYKKTIHQDVCPGDQVKMGPMCIRTPHH
ncbi:unnamed protein product, partial [Leptidea sinapis]